MISVANSIPSVSTCSNYDAEKIKKDVKKEKITAAVASTIKPGAGQVINGDYKKALGYLLADYFADKQPDFIPKEFIKVDKGLIKALAAIDAYRSAGKQAQKVEYKKAG